MAVPIDIVCMAPGAVLLGVGFATVCRAHCAYDP